jgi:RNA polymerase sigma factor (sigma-70 family)
MQRGTRNPSEWSAADLGAFFVENRSEFLAHARRATSSTVEAEEVVQDSLVRVLLACPGLESTEHARAYFHRVIENLSIDRLRIRGRKPQLVVLDDVSAELEARWHASPDLVESIAAADDAAIIREAISLLSSAERAALVMWEFEGRSTQEIARELGVKESAVRHTLSRARSSLKRILSERVVDEARGLTALDLLSISFRKSGKLIQKSSKAALSLILVVTAFLGFNSLTPAGFAESEQSLSVVGQAPNTPRVPGLTEQDSEASIRGRSQGEPQESAAVALPRSTTKSFTLNWGSEFFAGLDSQGMPTGFTVADSLGNLGTLFAGQQRSSTTETGLLLSNIVSTRSGAASVLLDQSIILDSFGTSYVARASAGVAGGWRPLNLSYISTEVERVTSGSYLLKAVLTVDSSMETVVNVPTSASGIDLESAPDFIVVRALLDPTKTKILAQAVFVSANSQGNGA